MKQLRTISTIFVLLGILTASFALAQPAGAAGIRYAKPTASGTGDCSSWANACALQTALIGATSGDEIWVAAGRHIPGALRTDTFQLQNGVAVYGGFDGVDDAARADRDPAVNVTILSGDIDNNDSQTPIITDLTTVTGNTTNSYHVVTGATSATLDGFTITAGQASGNSTGDLGGGMYNNSSSPTVMNVTFSGNSATLGGGMYNESSSPTLTNITFTYNTASFYGGGMYNYWSSPTVTNVTFSGNSADSGGGMYNSYSSPMVTNVTFNGNSVNNNGGGMHNYNSSPMVTNVTFSGNSATYGGGMHNYNSSPMVTNVTVSSNSATNGGGIYNYSSSPTLTNVIIANSISGGDCALILSTINAASANNLIESTGANACDLTDGDNGNIIGSSPLLDELGNHGGFTQTIPLLPGSSAIDATSTNCPITDQRGETRSTPSCDIGAFESGGFTISHLVGNGQSTLPGMSFNEPLRVLVTPNIAGDPVSGGKITFTAPSSGASANLGDASQNPDTIDLDGYAEVYAVANMETGPYTVTANASGASAAVDFNLENVACTAPITVTNATASGAGSLDYAVKHICSGGTITFNGDYTIHPAITLLSQWSMTIDGSGHDVIISGDSDSSGTGDLRVWQVLSGATVTMNHLTIRDGYDPDAAGAVNNFGTLTINNSTFLDNTSDFYAGAINNNGNLTITTSTFTGNSAAYGGGIMNNNHALTVANSTFTGNHAGWGGAIGAQYSNPTIINTTIADNTGGGGVGAYGATFTLKNSIVSNNTGGNCTVLTSGGFVDGGGNLVWGDTSCPGINANPNLGALADNGGPTQTMALLAGSAAIDAAVDATCAAAPVNNLDQRGVTRPQYGHCDIGAFEVDRLFSTDITLSASSVTENLPAGTTVGTLTTVDPDAGDSHAYTFACATPGADDISFQIGGAGSDMLQTTAVFDYEIKNTYNICIRADDGHGDIFDKNFTINVIDIPNVELLTPADAANVHVLRPTFDWVDFTGAIGYNIQISRNNTFTQLVNNTTIRTATSNFTPTLNLTANANLFWRVRAKLTLTTYSGWSEIRSFHTGNPPSVPMLVSPGNNALVTSATPLLNWNNSTVPAGTTFYKYEVEIALNNTFTLGSTTMNTFGLANSQINTPALSNATTYYWRVRSWNTGVDGIGGNADDDFSAWTTARSFRTPFAAPTLTGPANGATLVALKPTFTWNAVIGATSYTLQVSKSNTFNLLVINKTFNILTYTHTLNLTANTPYYWRVRANGPFGPGLWQVTVFSFTTGP